MKKGYKPKMAAVLASAMLAGTLPAVAYAESAPGASPISSSIKLSETNTKVAVDKSKAEELARKYVSIPKEYTLQSSSLSMDFATSGKRNVWWLEFVKKANGKHLGSISIQIHADTGQLLHFSTYVNDSSSKPSYPLKVERDEAKEIALKFIANIAYDYSKEIALNADGEHALPPLSGEVRHSLLFERVVNGVVFQGNYIRVVVDSEGRITNYQLAWDDKLTFPAADGALSQTEAETKLRSLADPVLSYILPYNSTGKLKPLLSYNLSSFAIDAKSGERIADSSSSMLSDKPLSDKPLGEAPKAGTVSEQQAIDKVKSSFPLPANAELTGTSYGEREDDNGTKSVVWSLNWALKKDGKETGSVYASVDGETGVITSYYSYSYGSETSGGTSVDAEKAVQLATAEVKKQLPWLANQIYAVKLDPKQYENRKPEEIGSYYIRFVRKIHGANVEYDRINVSVNARTGAIESYNVNLSKYEYGDNAPAVIGKDAAVDKWFDYYRVQLNYRLTEQYMLNGQVIPVEKYKLMLAAGEGAAESVVGESKIDLVYTLTPKPTDESVFLNAETGKWHNRETGLATELDRPRATDADGHWAESYLDLMVAYKALDLKDGKVRPNETVTRGELIKMLVLARSGGQVYFDTMNTAMAKESASFADVAMGSSYFAYIESALDQNLIDIGDGSFNPEGKVTRDDMAELIVRALGYNSLAKVDSIFASSFKDNAQIKNKGQASIVVGLGIMSLSEGKFQPNKEVTRAEAATAFFRYLQSRADLQEAPLRM